LPNCAIAQFHAYAQRRGRGLFGCDLRRGPPEQKITPHDLRHTCASIAIRAGVNVLALSRMLGHTSAKVTLDTYADLFDADLDAVASALDLKCAQSVPKAAPATALQVVE
jgi:integrase